MRLKILWTTIPSSVGCTRFLMISNTTGSVRGPGQKHEVEFKVGHLFFH